jgi:hypothetical protein
MFRGETDTLPAVGSDTDLYAAGGNFWYWDVVSGQRIDP